jgi:FdhD protein
MPGPSLTSSGIMRLPVQKIAVSGCTETNDPIVVEEPLEIRLEYGPATGRIEQPVSVTMRTPGQDEELAIGFLFTEGILTNTSTIVETARTDNTIRIVLDPSATPDVARLRRHFYTSSSCGVCGKTSIDALRIIPPISQNSDRQSPDRPSPDPQNPDRQIPLDSTTLYSLPSRLRQDQNIFDSTGGLHAAGLFDHQGRLLALREDIGRHNALDKLIGNAFMQNILPLKDDILLLSGRACFELIQKAAMAGITIIAAIGPPSSLAIRLAEEYGITLVGFLRHERFNIYSGAQRIRIR